MNNNEIPLEQEISLFDLWQKLQDGWRYVLAGATIGLLGAGVAGALIPPKYEAVAVLQVGKVAGAPVEAVVNAVERMKTSSFQFGVAERLGHQAWTDDLLSSFSSGGKHLSLQVVKATAAGPMPLIELKASGENEEKAKAIADATVLELANRHAEIAKPLLDKLNLDLIIAKEKLTSAERELEGITKLVTNVGVKDDRFAQLSLMAALRVQKEAETFAQRQSIIALETSLVAPATQPAKAIEAVFVTNRPASPKKGLLIALGLVGGGLAGVVVVFVTGAWRRERILGRGELAA